MWYVDAKVVHDIKLKIGERRSQKKIIIIVTSHC